MQELEADIFTPNLGPLTFYLAARLYASTKRSTSEFSITSHTPSEAATMN